MSELHEKEQFRFYKALIEKLEELSVSLSNISVSLVEVIENGKKDSSSKKKKKEE
jgi:hypothetical protein